MQNEKKQLNQPIILLALTIIFLIALSFLPSNMKIFGYTIKPVDLFMDIKPDSLLSSNYNIQPNNHSIQKYYDASSLDKSNDLGVNKDALLASVNFNLLSKIFNNSSAAKNNKSIDASTLENYIEERISGNTDQMKYFYDAVRNAGNKKIRIAHFGDSEIEGDLITAELRKKLQSKYGGEGVGYLSITSQDITFRTTTKQSFSDNWKTYSVLDGGGDKVSPGISGYVAVPQGVSWVKYQATGFNNTSRYFTTVRVFYSNSDGSSIKYSFDGSKEQTASLLPGKSVQELILKAPGKANSIKIITTKANQANFYGVSLEGGDGVYADNFPWRGNTGVGFRDIDKSVMKDFNKYLNYKLLVLSFGGNMVGNNSTDFSWYENQMVKIINNLKQEFPQTSILLVSVGDKSIKRGSRFITDPTISALLDVQKSIVQKTGIAFWNLFNSMGGKNSMGTWVDANPPLAFKDYTHYTLPGADKIGDMLSEALINEIR